MSSFLQARAVSAELGGREVLADFGGDVQPGRLIGLLGANGSGKSTLLRLLAGLLRPTAGEVVLNGRAVEAWPASARARQIAWLAQERHCPWPLQVQELVALGRLPQRAPWARPGKQDRAAIDAALSACELSALRQRAATRLSGGELARALLARALAVQADYLLADEPIAGLDPAHQLQVMQILRDQATQGRGVVVVLHDLSLAQRYCDELWLLQQGRLIAAGEPATVLSDANLRSAYAVRVLRDASGRMLQPDSRV